MKRLISGVILSTMILSLLSGCSGGGQSSTGSQMTKEELDPEKIGYYSTLELPFDKNNTHISILCDTDITTSNDSVVINELRRRTGLDIELIAVPRATYLEKAKVMLASKDNMPDIFKGVDINEYGPQGAFEAIDSHVDELPNFKEIFYTKAEENGTVNSLKNLRAADEKLYMFPIYDFSRSVNSGTLYRKDIFDKHNIPLWNGPDEFYEALKKLKTAYPDSIPFTLKMGSKIFTRLGESWGLGVTDFVPYYNEEEKTWKHMATDPRFKEILDYVKKLYDEKLLDPEFLTLTQAAWTQRMTLADKSFVTSDWIGRLDMFKEQTQNTIPDYDLRYGPPIGPTGKVISLPLVEGGSAVKKGKNSLLALKLCDYLISPSGAQLMTMGIEGVTYTMGEDGFAKYIGFEEGAPVGISDLEDKYGMFISGLYRRFDKRSTYFKYSEREQEAQDMALNQPDSFEPEDPKLLFTPEEKEIKSRYEADLKKKAEEFASNYILTSKTGDAAWQEWLAAAKNAGEEELISVYNAAQKRYDEMGN